MSPVPARERAPEYIAKTSEVLLRGLGQSHDLRRARTLRSVQGAGPKVCFLTPRSWTYHVQVEAVLGHALRLRGAHVSYLTCGGGLEICDRTNTWEAPPPPCGECARHVHQALDAHGLPWSALIGPDGADASWPELDEVSAANLEGVAADGLPLGDLMEVPIRWFLMDSRVEGDPLAPQTARRFLRSARLVARSLREHLERERPDTLVVLNGRFFFEAIAVHLAKGLGIRVVSYERGFVPGSLFLRRDEPACFYDVGDTAWERFRSLPLEPDQSVALDAYLDDRRAGRTGWWSYWDEPDRTVPDAVDGGRRVGLFTNLTWDSAVIGRGRACSSVQRWLTVVIDAARDRPQHEFVVRVHPAEYKLSGKRTREPIGGFLADAYGDSLPDNVRIIGPDDPLSSYALMEAIDVGMVFTSTTGLELALAGLPTIVAGRPHYADRGFTIDPADEGELIAALDQALADPAARAPDIELARRYGYVCWFRASLPFPFVSEPVRGLTRLEVSDLGALRPGRSAVLDLICDGILGDGAFVRG